MSKKMWNKIFKSKSNKNSKTLQAANKINKRCSIYDEYQQLNAALDLTGSNEKFHEISDYPQLSSVLTSAAETASLTPTKLPQTTTTFTKVVNSFSLKRSQNANGIKNVKGGNGNETNEKNSKKSELKTHLSSSSSATALSAATSPPISQNIYANHNNNSFNTPYDASLNQQQQLNATATTKTTATATTNLNNNEYLACNQNLANPYCNKQQKRLSQIVIVVKKINATALDGSSSTTTSSSDLNTNFINTTCTTTSFATNNLNLNQPYNDNDNNASTSTSTALVTPSLTATTIVNDENQLSVVNTKNCVVDDSVHYHSQHNDRRKFCFEKHLDNGNNIATPTESPDTNASVQLSPCPICARTFNPVTLRKHVGICEKMATKKRNKFDSFRQRREGTELAAYPLPKNFGLPEKTASSTSIAQSRSDRGLSPKPLAATQQVSSPIMSRKKAADSLIRSTARASMRKVGAATTNVTTAAAGNTTNVASSNFTRDRLRSSERSLTRRGAIQPLPAEQCPHCERCFGIKAYDRHVEWCKEKALQAAIKQGNTAKVDGSVAKARLEARIKYRAPCLKTKRSMNRDKYSGFAGEDNEPEDSPKPLKNNSNKTLENNLMTMSMTSSMTSERKITNPTGNINEPSKTATKTLTAANRKPTRDKSQTSQPTPPTTKTKTTTTTTSTTPVTATTEDIQESVINYEIEMPDFRLMGEQMATTAINNKQKSKTRTTKKINSNTSTASKSKKQQQQIISKNVHQKLETTDANINLPTLLSSVLAQKKLPSDLSLKSMRSKHSKELYNNNNNIGAADDDSGDGDDDDDDDYEHNDSDSDEERVLSAGSVDLTTSLTYYSPSTKLLEERIRKPKTMTKSLKVVDKKSTETLEENNKQTREEYSNKDDMNETPLSSVLLKNKLKMNIKEGQSQTDVNLQNCHILGSKKLMVIRKDGKRMPRKAETITPDASVGDSEDTSSILVNNTKKVSRKRLKKLKRDYHDNTRENLSDCKDSTYSEEDLDNGTLTNNEYEVNESILTSIPKLVIPQDNTRLKTKKLLKKNQKVEVEEFANLSSPKEAMKQKELKIAETKEEIPNFGESSRPPSTASSVDCINEERFRELSKFSENESLASPLKNKINLKSKSTKDEKSNIGELSRLQSRSTSVDCMNEERVRVLSEFSENSGLVSSPKHNISSTAKNTEQIMDNKCLEGFESKAQLIKTDIYKDCLTDSDELKLKNIKNALGKSIENKNVYADSLSHRTERDLYENCNQIQSSKVKSDTFIAELQHDHMSDQDQSENLTHTESIKSHVIKKNCPPQKPIRSRSTTPKPDNDQHKSQSQKPPQKNIELPTTTKSLRLPRVSTPPPPQIPKHSSQQSLLATPHSSSNSKAFNMKVETTTLKPLSLCRPKRNKVIRQAVSCTSTLPMKAIPLPKECIDIYSVSSAPNIPNVHSAHQEFAITDDDCVDGDKEYTAEEDEVIDGKDGDLENTCVMDKEIKVIKEPPQLRRNKSFTVSGLPENYDPFLSAKRQLEELCSPTSDFVSIATTTTTPQTPKLPSLPATPNVNRMSTSLILSSTATPNTIPSPMTTSQITHQQTPKTPTMARSSSFRRTASLRGPRRSPMLSTRPPLFAQKQRPTIQRGLSDEGPISTNFLKTEEYDEMPVRSVCVNDFAITKSPRVVRRDTSASNRKQQPLKLNINAGNNNTATSATVSPNIVEPDVVPSQNASKYVSKTDSLAVFLKYEHDLEKLNPSSTLTDIKEPTMNPPPSTNLDGPLNAKELKDKSNNLSKQNSAKNIKADILELTADSHENYDHNLNSASAMATQTNTGDSSKYTQVRLAPLTSKPTTPLTKPSTPLNKPSTPLTKPSTPTTVTNATTPQLTPLKIKIIQQPTEHTKIPQSPKPVALSSLFMVDRTTKQPSSSALLYGEHKPSVGSDFIDPKLINKCDNLPINLNLKRSDFKHVDSDNSEPRVEAFSSSSSESAAPVKNPSSQTQTGKFLPLVKQQPQEQTNNSNNLNINQNHSQTQTHHHNTPPPISNSQRNSAEGRNLFKRRMRLGRNQFLYDASPEGDSCSADDEANRSSMECDNHNFIKDHEKAFERLSAAQVNPIDAPFIPPLPAFDDFDFEEFLSSFENDEEQFPLFKDCREFLLNRTSKKQRSMLMPNSNILSNNNNSTNFKKSSPQTFPPLTPQAQSTPIQPYFQFPSLPQHPKNLFNSFSLNTRAKNKFDDLSNTRSTDTYAGNTNLEDFQDVGNHQKREIFISIETEQNDTDKSSISPNSIRNIVGNPQTVVEVELDAANDNKFSKISDDDADAAANHGVLKSSSMTRSINFPGHLERLPNVQLNNAKNLIQKMQDDFHHMGDEMNANVRQSMDHRTNTQSDMNANSSPMPVSRHSNKPAGTPSGDGYADSDELSSLDGYPLSSPNSRFGVSSKTSADSAYGSLSRQRSSELTSQRSSSRHRPNTSTTANTLLGRPLMEEASLGRSRQLSASSSSSSEHALPSIAANSSYAKHQQQQQQQQQQLHYNNNNNNNMPNDLDDMMRYERNNNYEAAIANTNSHSNLEASSQLYSSNSTMSTSMKMSRFCHECGNKFLVEQAKFCMDCGVKRIVL